MHQRIFSCPQSLIAKGVTLKASDWENPKVNPLSSDINKLRKTTSASLSYNKATNASLSSSYRKLVGIQRLSSSSFISKNHDSFNSHSRSTTAMKNATWDHIGPSAPTDSNRPSLFDLASLKTDGLKTRGTNIDKNSSGNTNLFTSEPCAKKASPRVCPSLLSLQEGSSFKFNSDSANKSGTFIGTMESNVTIADAIENSISNIDTSISFRNLINNSKSTAQASAIVLTIDADAFEGKAPRQINVGSMSSSELATIKVGDAFMYYSIPAVMKANLQFNEVDLSSLKDEAVKSKKSSCERKSRISFEAWDDDGSVESDVGDFNCSAVPTLKDLFFEMRADEDEEEDGEVSGEDLLVSFFKKLEQQ